MFPSISAPHPQIIQNSPQFQYVYVLSLLKSIRLQHFPFPLLHVKRRARQSMGSKDLRRIQPHIRAFVVTHPQMVVDHMLCQIPTLSLPSKTIDSRLFDSSHQLALLLIVLNVHVLQSSKPFGLLSFNLLVTFPELRRIAHLSRFAREGMGHQVPNYNAVKGIANRIAPPILKSPAVRLWLSLL